MSADKAMYDALVALAEEQYPGFAVKFKDESLLMKTIGKCLFFVKGFMGTADEDAWTASGYTTTMRRTVYFPSRLWLTIVGYRHAYKVLAHELVHIVDGSRMPYRRFAFLYSFPQSLAALALLAVLAWPFSNWWLFCLLFLGLAAPIPAPGRKYLEMRGYAMSMCVNFWRYGSVKQDQKDSIAEKFTGWDYYKTWPFEDPVYDEIDRWLEKIESGAILDGPENKVFKSVYDLMRQEGVIGA